MKRSIVISSIFIVSLILDQWTKLIVRHSLSAQSFNFLGDTIRLGLAENSGAFLSLGANLDGNTRFYIFTIGIGLLMTIALFILFRRKKMTQIKTVAYSLVLSGGVGNLIDRGMKSTVTDFINVGIGPLRTGVFNVADFVILVGVGILLVVNLKEEKSNNQK